MAKTVLQNVRLLLGGYDFTGDMNQVALTATADMLDQTAFSQASRARIAGMTHALLEAAGYFNTDDSTALNAQLFANIGGNADLPCIISPELYGSIGARAYVMRTSQAAFNLGAPVGELLRYDVSAEGSAARLARGLVLNGSVDSAGAANARTSSGSLAAQQVGAVGATERVYAALCVIAASGTTPTLDVAIESDDNEAMTSATSRITFTQATATGFSEWKELAGAVTDDWWRVTDTIAGTSPSFQYAVAMAIR